MLLSSEACFCCDSLRIFSELNWFIDYSQFNMFIEHTFVEVNRYELVRVFDFLLSQLESVVKGLAEFR